MIDLHSHILPGLDDGARTVGESIEIARSAVADGTVALAATPHVRSDYPTSPAAMEHALAALRAALADADVALDVRAGGEIALDRLDQLGPDDLRRFSLGGGTRYLLLETPYSGWPLGIAEQLFRVQLAGFVPVLAHPERNGEVMADPGRLSPLVESGALVQLTASSIDRRAGRSVAATARHLLESGLAHLVASDAHAPDVRGVGLSRAVEAVGDPELGRWLTELVPAAILADALIPERPGATRLRRRWRLARRG